MKRWIEKGKKEEGVLSCEKVCFKKAPGRSFHQEQNVKEKHQSTMKIRSALQYKKQIHRGFAQLRL